MANLSGKPTRRGSYISSLVVEMTEFLKYLHPEDGPTSHSLDCSFPLLLASCTEKKRSRGYLNIARRFFVLVMAHFPLMGYSILPEKELDSSLGTLQPWGRDFCWSYLQFLCQAISVTLVTSRVPKEFGWEPDGAASTADGIRASY